MDIETFTYLVVFNSKTQKYDGPILFEANGNGTMHLLDDEMYSIFDALEFVMHMPRNTFDMFNIDENLMDASHDTPHHIVLVPDNMLSVMPRIDATMIVLADECSGETMDMCERLNPVIGVHYSRELNSSLLTLLWTELCKHFKCEEYSALSNLGTHVILKNEHLKALPTLFLSRQFNEPDGFLSKVYNSEDLEGTIIQSHWNYMSRLNTLVVLGKQGVTTLEDMELLYQKQHEKEFKDLQVNVIVTFPGIPKRQKVLGMNSDQLTDQERRIIRIIGVHRAIARNGILIDLPCVSEIMFQKYDRLEECCKNGTNNNFVWRCLNDLGKEVVGCFNQKQTWLLRRARDITVFSDFPIGISILAGDEVPLQCYKSISYQPLTPLTRRLQHEMLKKQQYYFGEECKIAIAECIPNDDRNAPIYKSGEALYNSLKSMQTYAKRLSVVRQDIDSIANMHHFIANNADADILYISAHGHYDRKKNLAGIIIGDKFWMANEGIQTPPIVILSACHTAPRGFGCITIADMLLRSGAHTVLGTFIPVNAFTNTILMTRLFTYIVEAQQKNPQYKTLSDAWSGIIASNAIHELTATSKRFQKWMNEPGENGKPRIVDFQLNRCVGRLRRTHIYSDTIAILKEMLAEEGMEGKFDNILSQNDFFPESFFYQFLGNPENVFLYSEIFGKYIHRNMQNSD